MIRLLALLLLLCVTQVHAHKASTSYLRLQVQGTVVGGRWDIALRDLDYALGLDSDNDAQLTWGERRPLREPRIGRPMPARARQPGHRL